MDQIIDQISTSLKEIQSQLFKLNTEWDGDKNKNKGVQNKMIQGLHTQVKALGEQLEKLIKSMKDAQGLNFKIGEEASSTGRRKADYWDDLDQHSLMGKISITFRDPDL